MIYDEWAEVDEYKVLDHPGAGLTCRYTVQWKPGMSSDFSDFRASDGENPLDHWIESYTAFTSAVVRIKLSSSRTILIHYGNPSAVSESDGSKLFTFFDGFNALTADTTNNWTITGTGSYSLNGAKLTLTNSKTFTSKSSFGVNNVLEARAQLSSASTSISLGFQVGGNLAIFDNDDIYATTTGVRSWINYGSGGASGNSVANTATNWNVYKISRVSTTSNVFSINDVVKSTHTTGVYTGNLNVVILNTDNSAYYDWILVRPYVATEPSLVYVSSNSNIPAILTKGSLAFATGTFLRAQSGMFAGDVSSKGSRIVSTTIDDVGIFVNPIKQKGTWIRHCLRPASMFLPIIKEHQDKIIDFHRKADMFTSVKEKVNRNVHSHRTSASYVSSPVNENNSRKLTMPRYYYIGQGCFIPEPACKVTVIRSLNVDSKMSVGTPSILLKRYYYGVRQHRETADYIEAQNIIADWEADWHRDALNELLPVEIETIPNPGREVLFKVSPVFMCSSRHVDNYMEALLNIPEIGLRARLGSEIYRDSRIEVSSIDVSSVRTGDFHRQPGSSIAIVEFSSAGSGLIERLSAMYSGSSSISAERILHTVRESAMEIPEPCVIAFGATNADRPHAPFEIDIDKPDFIITVDTLEYGLELSKNLFYAIIRDGETLIEITQYDTETFYGEICDTDPVTGESRAMPLGGKTVKAILKGGAPDTTVVADCTIVEDGKVRVDLTSTDTAVSGKYFLKFVVLAEGYRKEIPEARDDYLEFQINDATYIEI